MSERSPEEIFTRFVTTTLGETSTVRIDVLIYPPQADLVQHRNGADAPDGSCHHVAAARGSFRTLCGLSRIGTTVDIVTESHPSRIETERLILRPPGADDSGVIARAYPDFGRHRNGQRGV